MSTAIPSAAPSAIRLQGRAGFVAAAFGVRTLFSLLAGFAVASSIGATGIGHFPGGDALLFEDGGLFLLELLRVAGPQLAAAVSVAGAILALGLLVNLLVLALLLVALNGEGRLDVGAAFGRALTHLPAFFLLGALFVLAQSLLVLGASLSGTAIRASALGERATDALTAVTVVLAVLLATALGAVLDVARAGVVRYELSGKTALLFALDAARAKPVAVLLGWLPFAAAGAVLVLGCAPIVESIDVSRPGTARVLLVAAVHQLTLFALLWLRAAWLARALRLVARHAPSRRFTLLA